MLEKKDRERERKEKGKNDRRFSFERSLFSVVLRAPVAPLLRTVKRNEVFFSVAEHRGQTRSIRVKT